eukprot:scaffold4850_cov340-Prasinococcus_capsulatus_cf.AAC.7
MASGHTQNQSDLAMPRKPAPSWVCGGRLVVLASCSSMLRDILRIRCCACALGVLRRYRFLTLESRASATPDERKRIL